MHIAIAMYVHQCFCYRINQLGHPKTYLFLTDEIAFIESKYPKQYSISFWKQIIDIHIIDA